MAGVLFFLFLLYFVPTIIAVLRKHKDTPAIAAINILLGWTFVGWFMSFVWSLADPRGRGAATTTVVVNTAVAASAHAGPAPMEYRPPAPAPSQGDEDTTFWDRVDKSDPDMLEEYLIRFPSGRFTQLARTKLERLGGAPAPAAPSRPAPASPPKPSASQNCTQCGVVLQPSDRFCGGCGAPAAAMAG